VSGAHQLFLAFAVVGVLVLALGLFSKPLERLPLSAPLVSLLAGVALGPQALGWLDPGEWGDHEALVEHAARLTIAIGLMAIALRLPPDYLSRHWRSLLVMLLLAMPLMALAGAALAGVLLGLPLLLALLAGAILSPTDPIVATSIATGEVAERSLPERLRHLILGESAANDGLAFPLVWLPLALLSGEGLAHWSYYVVLWQVGGAIAFGALAGFAAGRLLGRAEEHRTIEVASFFAYTLALTVLVLGGAELLRLNGILAVFVAGIAFSRLVGQKERAQEERVQEAINGFFTLPIFALIGLVIPWRDWADLGWRGAAFVVALLLLRRLPAVWLLHRITPALGERRDALFAGWFGPIGAAGLFYAVVAARHTGDDRLFAVAMAAICASVLVHGMTAWPFTRLYAQGGSAKAG
jgi:NhaP-type Na+/H+ or K+/H+ antiporter